jgi:hypothetical protein
LVGSGLGLRAGLRLVGSLLSGATLLLGLVGSLLSGALLLCFVGCFLGRTLLFCLIGSLLSGALPLRFVGSLLLRTLLRLEIGNTLGILLPLLLRLGLNSIDDGLVVLHRPHHVAHVVEKH